MKKKIDYGLNDFMISAAFRYCLGRKTYAVGICCDWLKEHWGKLSNKCKWLIFKEINEALNKDIENPQYEYLGSKYDKEEWISILQLEVPHDPNRIS